MTRRLPDQLFHDPCYRVKRKNPDGTINPLWMELHENGKKNGRPRRGPFLDSPPPRKERN